MEQFMTIDLYDTPIPEKGRTLRSIRWSIGLVGLIHRIRIMEIMMYDQRHVMEKIGDVEGLSDVPFNLAIVSTEEGKIDTALEYFRTTEDFPSHYPAKRDERRMAFKKR
jgi:hypothetical protein